MWQHHEKCCVQQKLVWGFISLTHGHASPGHADANRNSNATSVGDVLVWTTCIVYSERTQCITEILGGVCVGSSTSLSVAESMVQQQTCMQQDVSFCHGLVKKHSPGKNTEGILYQSKCHFESDRLLQPHIRTHFTASVKSRSDYSQQ